MFAYAVKLTPDETPGGEKILLAATPALPEVATFGETKDEALKQAALAVTAMLDYRMEKGLDIPEPDAAPGAPSVVVPSHAMMKVLLYQAMRERGLNKNQFGALLKIDAGRVAELFDVDRSADLEAIDAAMNALALYTPASARAAAG